MADASTLYFSGLPWEATVDTLKDWITTNSSVKLEDISVVNIPKWHDSGRGRGFAFVSFASEEAKEEALKADRIKMGERYIEIKVSTGERPSENKKRVRSDEPAPANCKVLFIKNLPYETNEDEVKGSFSKFGEVVNVRLGRWNNTGNLKGFGYVEFSSEETVKKIMGFKEDIKVGGRAIHCDYESIERPKNSFRDSKGRQWNRQQPNKRHRGH